MYVGKNVKVEHHMSFRYMRLAIFDAFYLLSVTCHPVICYLLLVICYSLVFVT